MSCLPEDTVTLKVGGFPVAKMTEEEYLNQSWQRYDQRPDREKKEKSDTRRFWFLSVPLGAFCGLIALMLTDAGSAFWVAWLLSAVAIHAALEGAGTK